jgi:hypothetical protein
VSRSDIQHIVDQLGSFGSDNRAGLDGQLHRISAIRNREGIAVGLTMRVGRHVHGNADMMADILLSQDGQPASVLLLGEPGRFVPSSSPLSAHPLVLFAHRWLVSAFSPPPSSAPLYPPQWKDDGGARGGASAGGEMQCHDCGHL